MCAVDDAFLSLSQNTTLQTATNGQPPLSAANDPVQLKCNYCRGAFSLKPETLEWGVRPAFPLKQAAEIRLKFVKIKCEKQLRWTNFAVRGSKQRLVLIHRWCCLLQKHRGAESYSLLLLIFI